jgi:hypothetical protein
MGFEIRAEGVDVEGLLRAIRERLEEKKRSGILTDEELRWIAEQALEPVHDAGDVRRDLLEEFRGRDASWNFTFDAETLYRSSRGVLGRLLEAVRGALRPLQKLFWNPNPMISALSRQADLNRHYVQLLHNLAVEVTRLSLEADELRRRNLDLAARVEALARRGRALETLVEYRRAPGGRETGPDQG